MRRNALFILAAAAALTVGSAAHAKMPMVKQAQALGFKNVENCQSCHVDKMPKKDAKGEPYNEMGKFLMAKKAEKKAAEVDLNWLKDYKGK
jgi:hypothetical protein